MGNWWKKSVVFDLNKPEDAELARYAKSFDNFSAAVRRWLRELKQKEVESKR